MVNDSYFRFDDDNKIKYTFSPFDNVIMDTFRIPINHNGTDMWKMRNVLRDDFTTRDTEWDELV